MIVERDIAKKLKEVALVSPAITLTGPRQSGKSTLVRQLFPHLSYVDFDYEVQLTKATQDPLRFLAGFPNGAIIDEVQKVPRLFPALKVAIDENPSPGRWILTGFQNFLLLQQITESLAGRTALFDLLPLSRGEVMKFPKHPGNLWESLFMGSYPYLHGNGNPMLKSSDWLNDYISTYLERDVRLVRVVDNLSLFRKFLIICATRSAQELDYGAIAKACEITQSTAQSWMRILEASYIVFLIPPINISPTKELTKRPKLHFYDSGLLCQLLGIESADILQSHSHKGAIFESWVASEIAKAHASAKRSRKIWYYRDRSGVEADLILRRSEKDIRIIELKSSSNLASEIRKSLRNVEEKLSRHCRPSSSTVIYGGDQNSKDGTFLSWKEMYRENWNEIGVSLS